MKILPIGAPGAGLLARLHAEAFAVHQAWDEASFARLLQTPGMGALVAHEAQEPMGFILYRLAGMEGEILTLAVRPAFRRRGAGRRLAAAALAEMGMNGARQVFLEVAQNNAAAIALYESLGFAQAGVRKGYYATEDGGRTDARVLAYRFGEACGCET